MVRFSGEFEDEAAIKQFVCEEAAISDPYDLKCSRETDDVWFIWVDGDEDSGWYLYEDGSLESVL